MLAGAIGLEPTTLGFGDRCSTDCATPLGPARRGSDTPPAPPMQGPRWRGAGAVASLRGGGGHRELVMAFIIVATSLTPESDRSYINGLAIGARVPHPGSLRRSRGRQA